MASTPEGAVKAKVKKLLDQYPHYRHMPVPVGYGAQTLDFLICSLGLFIAVETKAPGKKPTPRQEQCIREITAAGGAVFIVSNDVELEHLKQFMDVLHAANNRQP